MGYGINIIRTELSLKVTSTSSVTLSESPVYISHGVAT